MNADISIENLEMRNNESVGDIHVKKSKLTSIQISKEELENFLNTEEAQNQLGPELKVRQILIRNNSSQNVDDVYGAVLLGLSEGKNIENFISEFSGRQWLLEILDGETPWIP